MIDPKAIKPGDEVTVRAKVTEVLCRASGRFSIRVLPFDFAASGDQLIGVQYIATHTPAPREWKKGDLVRTASGSPAVIQGISDDWAWVRLVDGSQPFTLNLSDLTPIPQDGEQ